jgi:hypothetical protein
MRNAIRVSISSATAGLALVGGLALGVSPIAAAAGPKPMHISASGGDKTAVDKDGTEGSFTDSVQGIEDADGDQDAFNLTKSEEATPQDKAKNKMTK